MVKKLGAYIFISLLYLGLSGCAGYMNLAKGDKFLMSGQYNEAIVEYEEALQALSADTGPSLLRFNILNNLGYAYDLLDNYEKASKYYLMGIKAMPEAGYYGYINLAGLNYRIGKLKEAYEYSQKAKELVNSSAYEKMEKLSGYHIDAVKNMAIVSNEFYMLRVSFNELMKEYELKNYDKAVQWAEKILDGKYHAALFGGWFAGNTISKIETGSLADLNGFVTGDKVLEIDRTIVSDLKSAVNSANKLMDKYGSTVMIKIERKGRVIETSCKLIYPELEKAQLILQEAKAKMATTPEVAKGGDKQAPWIKILEPKSARGIKITAKQNVTFVILASDNVAVKDVLVNNVSCVSAEAGILEKTFLPGDVKKYTATIPLTQAKNIFTVKAVDASGNAAQQQIEIEGNESVTKEFEKIYDHRIAVVIGINKYNPWPGLEFAVNDAKAIRDKLSKMGYDKIIELYDRGATRARIMRILADELPGTMGKNDSLMVYFAGHGATEDLSGGDQEGYIIPVDGDVKNYRGTAVSMTSIHEMIKKYRAKHILFVFDSCYSGLGLKRGGGAAKTPTGFIKTMAQKRVTQIITAGGKDEQAAEEKGHGVFTKALLDALDGKDGLDKDGYILASDIGQMIRKKVGEKTNFRQTPLFGWLAGEGDFIFESFEK